MKRKKYLSIELTPGRAFVSLINEGSKKKKILNTFVATFSESCYSKGMFFDTNQEISSAIKNGMIENKIHVRSAIVTVHSPLFKTDEMEVPASAKKTLKQFVRQQLYSKNQISGDYVVDAVKTGADDPDDKIIWTRVSYCSREFLENISAIMENAGLVPEKLIPLELSMEALFERYCGADGFPLLVHLTRRDLHIMFSNGDGSYSCRSIHLKEKLSNSDMVLSSSADDVNDIAYAMEEVVPNILNITRSSANTSRSEGGACTVYFYGDRDYIMAAMERLNVTGIVSCELVQAGFFHVNMTDLAASYYINTFSSTDVAGNGKMPCDLFTSFANDASILSDKRIVGTIVGTVIILLILCLYGGMLSFQLKATEDNVNTYTDALSDSSVTQAILDSQNLEKEIAYYKEINAACGNFIQYLDNDNRFNSTVVNKISEIMPEGTHISNYTYNEGSLTLSCTAYNQNAPADFTKLLSDSGNYESVSYTGFTKSSDTEGNDIYSFSLTIILW